ncbi:olfactory receptor 11A1-like [Pseudophryne corroboree]|uniref:olfactory receptor 11A1-like n=1 Tax=Pseudophryne corroboree TaxID=495146 RepID=UPI003081557E
MDSKPNSTAVKEFFLLGFQDLHISRFILFLAFVLVYVATIAGNVLIITLVMTTRQLHHPMYFFLSHLSWCDIVLTTTISPNTLYVIFKCGATISVAGCIIQLYIFGVSSVAECLLLTVMSYDRYLAICKPLQYYTTMNGRFCLWLVVCCWVLGCLLMLIVAVMISNLNFCGPNILDHFFCDYGPVVQLSCSDTSVLEILLLIIAAPETIVELTFIISTYACIILAILRIASTVGRQNAFSTCSSHLSVVCTYYGSLIAIYVSPSKGKSFNTKKMLSLLYITMTPIFNPIIYSMKSKEIRTAIRKIILKNKMIFLL